MIAYYLFVTYDICGRVSISKLGWGGGGGGYYYYVHILVSQIVFFCFWVTSYRCMLVITLLLHMLYVIGFHCFSMLMVRYCRYYTVVTYDICVMASVAR